MKLDLNVIGTFCNTWPELTIQQNNNIVFCNHIENITSISLTLDYAPFAVGMQNKKFGENNEWDTLVDQDNNILADKTIIINEFLLDDVSILGLLKYLNYNDTTIDDNILRFNGNWNFDISTSAYDYIIDLNYSLAPKVDKKLSTYSDTSILGQYEEHRKLIKKIRDTLDI